MRAVARLGQVCGLLAVLAALILFVLAIWTVGPDSARLAGTGSLFGVAGGFVGLAGTCWIDMHPRRDVR